MRPRVRFCTPALALLFAAAPVAHAQSLPPYVPLPPGLAFASPESLAFEERGEAEFWMKEGVTETRQGRHWRGYLAFASGANPGAAATWAAWRPALEKSGFKQGGNDGATTWTLKRVDGGVESWLKVALGDYQDPLLELIEITTAAPTFAIVPPAAQPERFGAQEDFPFLGHLPGMRLVQSVAVAEPLDVTVTGVDAETVFAGTSHVVKSYAADPALSRLQFAELYGAALEKAGWKVRPRAPGSAAGEGALIASYSKNGRSIWASLRRSSPDSDQGATLAVADLGAENWAAKLARDCRLPLYGVHFDFGKATLRSESEVELERARSLLASEAALAVTVEGHTDAVGSDEANVALSEARARAVMQWLTAHGIPAARLAAKGWGEARPVSTNDTDAGRSLNRRVELRRTGCEKP